MQGLAAIEYRRTEQLQDNQNCEADEDQLLLEEVQIQATVEVRRPLCGPAYQGKRPARGESLFVSLAHGRTARILQSGQVL